MARIDTNLVIIDGKLGADAKIYHLPGGKAKVVFTLGSNGREKIDGELRDHVTWMSCVMWGDFAEKMHPYLKKGKWLQVQGHLRNHTTGQGSARTTETEVNVKHLVLPPPE